MEQSRNKVQATTFNRPVDCKQSLIPDPGSEAKAAETRLDASSIG